MSHDCRPAKSSLQLTTRCGLLVLGVIPVAALADDPFQHNGVNKVYHPYVQPLETEIEYRSVYHTDGDPLEDGVAGTVSLLAGR